MSVLWQMHFREECVKIKNLDIYFLHTICNCLPLRYGHLVLRLLLFLFSHWIVSDSLQAHGLQHTSPPCPSPSPRVCPSSCPLHRLWHPAISSSDALFSFCPQSFPASGTFPVSWLNASGDQNTGASASASTSVPSNEYSGLISLQIN